MGRPIRQETLIDRGVVRSRLPVEAAVLGKPKPPEQKEPDPYRPVDEVCDLQRDISVNFKLL
jgi:hypothetical protein